MLSSKLKKGLAIAGFLVLVVISLYYIFFKVTYTEICDSDTCFSQALSICNRVEYAKDSTDAVWYYKIMGPTSKNECEVYVRLAQLRKGSTEIIQLEGKDMTCSLPYSVVESPQNEIERCHGPLREEIQSILIQKMHSYLLENLGKINQEFTSIV